MHQKTKYIYIYLLFIINIIRKIIPNKLDIQFSPLETPPASGTAGTLSSWPPLSLFG